MRTLLRDDDFGEVKNTSATTRHVACATLYDRHDTPLVALYDTPGLEDASGVMDFLQDHTNARADGVDRLQKFLLAVDEQSPLLTNDFSQEAKVIRALLSADIAIYVVDVREPILSKYQDELAILASSGVPVLPVFNFVQANTQKADEWRQMLAKRALHVYNAFDTVAFDFDAEMSLWQNLGLLTHSSHFATLANERTQLWQELGEQGCQLVADFLINVASFSKKLDEKADPTPTQTAMQQAVLASFDSTIRQLSELYKFYHTDIKDTPTTISSQTQDIFDKDTLARYGIRTASGSVAGMIVGMGIDMATLGVSMGMGTAFGGVIGGMLSNTSTLKDKIQGVQTLHIDNPTLALLATKLQALHHALRHRGHASLNAITIPTKAPIWQGDKLPTPLKKARNYPHYTSLDDISKNSEKSKLRSDLRDDLAWILCENLSEK